MLLRRDLLIKHMIGSRPFLEANKQDVKYEINEAAGGWEFIIYTEDGKMVDDIVTNRMELNIFVVEEYQDQPTRKWWYYSKNGQVSYDEERKAIKIFADSKMGYQA